MKPRPTLTGSKWADENFQLSAEYSAITGKWKTYPWQKELLDAMTDDISSIVIIKKPTRIGYSILLSIVIAYYIHQKPSNQFHYQPNDDEAKGYAEDTVEPMIRDNPTISKLVETDNNRGRTKKEKTLKKSYPAGHVEFLGAESDKNFNRRTGRVVSGDEVDAWKREAGNTGDKIVTMFRRTSDFWNRKNILGGKPIGEAYDSEKEIDEKTSILDTWFKKGTQEYLHIPCPKCDYMQKFEFEQLVWNKKKDANGKTIKHYTETAHFKCVECQEKIFDKDKRELFERCKWVAENPNAEKGIRSFSVWAMVSYSPNVTWSDIVKEFLAAKNSKLKLKAFTNEVLGRTWEEDYTKINIGDFEDRLELYDAQIPKDVLILSAGVDTQDDRLECEVVGWCKDERSYSIEYKIFHGDTTKPEVWKKLDNYLLKTFYHENGGMMKIYTVAIDTGGHSTQAVYNYCKPRFIRRVYAIKGAKAIDAPVAPRLASQISMKAGGKVPLFNIGVNMAKDVISSYLSTLTVGAGYMHFPHGKNYNVEYFKQLTAEVRDGDGRWSKIRARNEALDVRVYAYCSLFIANVDLEVMALNNKPMMFIQTQKKEKKRKKIDALDEY
ncbi:MAG: terminase gpA endonuclease subunit [Campylobacterota bacterium]|nr:terminase gpA endonuclease subunit [Campylobacterota bacterium]